MPLVTPCTGWHLAFTASIAVVLGIPLAVAALGRPLIVLHDLNLACRYADHLIAMRGGAIAAQGRPTGTVTAALVREVFHLEARIIADPLTGTPWCCRSLRQTGAGTCREDRPGVGAVDGQIG